MAYRASSLQATNTLAINREIDSKYDAVIAVRDALPEIELVAENMDSVVIDANNIDAIVKVASNIDDVNNFSKLYTIGSTAPTEHTEGDLWFDTVNNLMMISDGSSFIYAYTGNGKFNSVQLVGGSGDQGTLAWNNDEETLDLVQNGATLQLGQEVQVHCRNSTPNTIGQGIVVMATGTVGNSGRIKIAPYTSGVDTKYIIGVTTEDIAAGTDGKVTTFGKVRGINTSAWNDGDVLYVGNNGALTNVEPAEGIINAIAFVINKHTVNGTIMVRFTPASEGNAGQYLGNAKVKGIEYLAKSGIASDQVMILGTQNAMSVDSFVIANGGSVTLEDSAVWKII